MHDIANALSIGIIGVIGTIVVALISGVFSMVGLIISKEQKLSDFRQAWIDALRDDISAFVSHAIMISAYITVIVKPLQEKRFKELQSAGEDKGEIKKVEEWYHEELKEYLRATSKNFSRLNVHSTRIKLRLSNPREDGASDLLLKMAALEKTFGPEIAAIDDKTIHDIVDEIERISRPLLKKEWERVKAGELTFRIAKFASVVISALLALVIAVLIVSVPAYLFGYLAAVGQVSEKSTQGDQGRISIRQQVEPYACAPAPPQTPILPNK